MTTLFVDQSGSRISHAGGAVEIRLPGGSVRRVPIAQLARVIVASEADVAVGLLRQLAAARVPLVVLRGRSRADAALLWPQAGDARRRLAQRRVFDDPAIGPRLARLLVRSRLRAQAGLLMSLRTRHPKARYAISRAARAIWRIRAGLDGQRGIDTIRGAEGAAARLYFAAWSTMLPKTLGFHGRRRRPPPDPVNAALSLGYSLLHARALEACHVAGLDAGLGILHMPSYNRASLACDLVETERVAVERWVATTFAEGTIDTGDFERSSAGCLLAKRARGAYFAGIEPVLADSAARLARRARRLVTWLESLVPEMEGVDLDES